MLTNKITKKIYIGKSSNLKSRFYEYYSPHLEQLASSSLICKALSNFGLNNFSLSILEYCEKDVLSTKEQYFISALNPQYNIRKLVSKNKTPIPVSFISGKPIVPPKAKANLLNQTIFPSIVQKFLDLTTNDSNRKKGKG
jgi:group I intron endonuclease